MEAIIFLTGVAAILAVIALLAHLLGWVLTEVTALPWDFKPFNCRPCLTFWLTWGGIALCAPIIGAKLAAAGITCTRGAAIYALVLVGALLGVANFWYVKSKTNIHE